MNERAAFFSNRETTDYGRHMHIKRSDAGIKNPLDCEILEPGSRFFASIFWAERGEKRESKKTLTTLISVSVFYVFRLTHTQSHTVSRHDHHHLLLRDNFSLAHFQHLTHSMSTIAIQFARNGYFLHFGFPFKCTEYKSRSNAHFELPLQLKVVARF